MRVNSKNLKQWVHVTVPQAKIVDPLTGEVLPLGELGELMVRGHCVMKGYWGDEDKTKECLTADGWYRTGWAASSVNLL